MNNIEDALLRMVKSYRMIGEMLNAYVKVGLDSNTLFQANAELAEAIYTLLGEHVEEFEQSATHTVLNAPYLTDERRAAMLYAEWKNNHRDFPAPNTFSRDEMKESVRKNGGYFFTPEGG